MKKVIRNLVIIAIILLIGVAVGPFYILMEGEQAVVTRFGAIVDSNTEAGLKFKIPFVDTVVKYPKKILSWDGDAQRIPTAENQFIWVDATARWVIQDPVKFYESVTNIDQGFARLDDVIDSSVRTIVAENPLRESVRNSNYINETDMVAAAALTGDDQEGLEELTELTDIRKAFENIQKGREELSNEMFDMASKITPQYGIVLEDIIIRQIRYSDDLTNSVYNRMIKERNQVAQAYRSHGQGKKAEWLGKLENEKKSILSEAYRKAEEIRGNADAEATQIYADAYSVDPDFFKFWRSMESYRKTLPGFKKIISTELEYFDFMTDRNGR